VNGTRQHLVYGTRQHLVYGTRQHLVYGTRQHLVYADGVNILGGSVHSIKRNAEDLVVASKETGLEVNADKTKYMVMSRDRNAAGSHSIMIDSSSFERAEQFRYLEQI
jgi:hypothetical protein